MENRYVNFIYIAGLALFSYVYAKTVNLIWEVTEISNIDVIPNQLSLATVIGIVLAIITTVVLYKIDACRDYVREVVVELEHVDWPTWKETQKSTIIVIGFALFLGAYLFGIDKIWSLLTNYILVS